jgi:hypothetical protein
MEVVKVGFRAIKKIFDSAKEPSFTEGELRLIVAFGVFRIQGAGLH